MARKIGNIEQGEQLLSLVTLLAEGQFDTPLWSGFLDALREYLDADYAILILEPPGRPMDEGLQLASGCEAAGPLAKLFRACIASPARRRSAIGAKANSLEDLLHPKQAQNNPSYRALIGEWHIGGALIVRFSEPKGVDGWLIVARQRVEFKTEAETILSNLVRPLRAIIRNYVSGEIERFRFAMAEETVRRLQCGWLLLDEGGFVLASDSFGETCLSTSGVLSKNSSGRLVIRPSGLEREVLRSISVLAQEQESRPRAISLRGDPWLDMLLVPGHKKMLSDTAVPTVIAYVHGDNWGTADRCGQLSDMFELSASEAKLALALCRGKTIAEAAIELGFTLETARSYSKTVYMKTGTHGMADLVRIVMESVLTLTPDG